jgi:hypothetical protein
VGVSIKRSGLPFVLLLRFLFGLFLFQSLGRFFLGFFLDVGALAHGGRSSRGGLNSMALEEARRRGCTAVRIAERTDREV